MFRLCVPCICAKKPQYVLTAPRPQGGSPGSGDPPEPEELIKALQELENSASSDAIVSSPLLSQFPSVPKSPVFRRACPFKGCFGKSGL